MDDKTIPSSADGEIRIDIQRTVLNQGQFDSKFEFRVPRKSVLRNIRKRWDERWDRSVGDIIGEYVPITKWIRKYNAKDLLKDVIAGVTVGILTIPQAMAYASLANVHAIVGLYTSFFPTILYGIFGSSKHITIGMFAVVALMVSDIIDENTKDRFPSNGTYEMLLDSPRMVANLEVLASLTFLVGLCMVAMELCRLYFLTSYLSEPLVGGFTTGAACHVFASQLPKVLGIKVKNYQGLFKLPKLVVGVAASLPQVNYVEIIISALSILILVIGKFIINPRVVRHTRAPLPFELFVIAVATFVTSYFGLSTNFAVAIVGPIPRRLPMPRLPNFNLFRSLLLDAFAVTVVIYSVTVSVGKVFAKRHEYHINPKQEIRALAICQLGGAIMGCHPASGSLSRAVLNSQMEATSEMSSIVSALLVLFVILVIGPLLHFLPMAVLASVIIVALMKMFAQFSQICRLWTISKVEMLTWVVSFLATFLWNVAEGLAISVVFALITVIMRTQWPKSVLLGQMPDTEIYKDKRRYRICTVSPNILIFRYDAPLLFLNSDLFKEKALQVASKNFKSETNKKRFLIIDASGFTFLDYTGVEVLKDLHSELKKHNITMLVASAKAHARGIFVLCDLFKNIPAGDFFPTLHDAYVFAENHLTSTTTLDNGVERSPLLKPLETEAEALLSLKTTESETHNDGVELINTTIKK